MTDLPWLYAVVAFLVTGLAAAAVQSRRPLRFRLAGLAVAAAALGASWAGLADALGRAKPTAWEFSGEGDMRYDVLYADIQPGAPIHVLLRFPGLDEPRLYVMPWNAGIAAELRRGLASTAAPDANLQADGGLFESDVEDRERIFHETPIAALPRKDEQRFEPERFVPDEGNTMFGVGEPDG